MGFLRLPFQHAAPGPSPPNPCVPACFPGLGQVSSHQGCFLLKGELPSASGKAARSPQGLVPAPEQCFQEPSKGHSRPGCTGDAPQQTAGQQNSGRAILSVRSTGIRSA